MMGSGGIMIVSLLKYHTKWMINPIEQICVWNLNKNICFTGPLIEWIERDIGSIFIGLLIDHGTFKSIPFVSKVIMISANWIWI